MTRSLPPGPADGLLGLSFIRRFMKAPLEFITEVGERYGDLACFRMGPVRACFVNNPELIREVLVTKAKIMHKQRRALDVLRQVDGEGLVITEGPLWQRQRRLLQPAFHPRRMTGYARAIVERTRMRIEQWRPGQTLEMVDQMTHLTVEIIAKVFYNVEVADQSAILGRAVRILSQAFYRQMTRAPFLLPDWLPLPAQRRKRWAINTLRGLIDQMIRARRADPADLGDLLSMLLLAVDEEGDGQGMSDRQARDEAVTMFNAGHDSTAAALTWCWYLVALHPEVESRLIDEARGVLAGRDATAEDLPRLAYTDMVVREALRLYPPVWTLFVRVPEAEFELGGYRIPRGTWLYIFPWVTQRDARFFPRPLTFDPERFSPRRAAEVPQYGWIPFGAGPHACIGQHLATCEMVLILATVLSRFRLALAPNQPRDVVPEPLLAIRPKGGLRLVVNQ